MAITTEDVLEIMDGESTREDLSTFITQSETFYSLLINDGENTSEIKDIVIKYLTAHFVLLSDGIIESTKDGDFSQKYKLTDGESLNATHFGKTAILFDSTGKLKNYVNDATSKVANIRFLG